MSDMQVKVHVLINYFLHFIKSPGIMVHINGIFYVNQLHRLQLDGIVSKNMIIELYGICTVFDFLLFRE